MITLSKTLRKTYVQLICFFTIVLMISLSITGKYLINSSKRELRNAMAFLKYELLEEVSSKSMKIFTDDLVNKLFRIENPNLEDLEIRIEYKNHVYSENISKRLLNAAVENTVTNVKLYDYMILKNELINKDGDIFTVVLVKNLKKEKTYFLDIVYIFASGLAICIIISSIAFSRVLKKIKKELTVIETINSNVTLENLKVIKPTSYFKEFDNILDSYEEMLTRLDIQNRKQIEFVHNSSHELKTPLFIIGGYIDMIKRWGKKDPEIFDEALTSIEEETKNMNILIEKLLFIAKESEIKSEQQDIELSEIVLECISNLKRQYPKSNIEFTPEYTIVKSDEALVKLLIKNLLENAIKYGRDELIEVKIESDDELEEAILTIEDNGIGMTPTELEHIYDRFFRANKSRSKEIHGHGLGMSIVKRILTLLNLDIKISSTPDVGTTVKVFFKL
ncbi:sensor histidine kinase [Candidatus Cetobacterium colombiensis]|uniref:histidine kinase n=1 Tax=Candidatus Cetobacterium colombiensis TaxID=3073100 RepID=A0ABU4WBF9_9FUSO|nr:HAMP domain-containing sensor histidine kinase [Candidatus Cetobacterium colombiensis]MDX8336856.1 HAMP domain-containing sensor histidine kinase [Candidatus Cetobacterium colombiensis]